MNVKPADASAWCTWLEQHGLSIAPKDLETVLAHDLARGELESARASLQEGSGARAARVARVSLAWDAALEHAENDHQGPDWVSRLPEFDGEIVTGGERLEMAAWDFGKVRRRRPAAVLRPAGTRDVLRAIRFCREENIGLSSRGFAHSAGAQMQVRGGLVLDMKSMNRVLAVTDDHIEVEAGAGWDVVLMAATERGRTPPIVTDWLKVSVGGTLSMGGFGFMSFWRGTQMDHVLELEVVTGTGEVIRCSSHHHQDLFDAVRGTHGTFGIITRAWIPLEAAPNKVRLVQASYGSIRAMMSDIENHTRARSADLIHAFAARKTRQSIVTKMNSTETMPLDEEKVDKALLEVPGQWVYNLELVDFIGGPHGETHELVDPAKLNCEEGLVHAWEMDWTSFCFRVPPLVIEEQFRGAAPHPELCAWVPMDAEGLSLLEAEFERLQPVEDIGDGPVLFFPLKTDVVSAPWFRLPRTEYCFFWGLLRRADPATPERISELMADNEAVFERVLRAGGERYLPDTPPEDLAFWKRHFGPIWPQLVQARNRWDPDGLFQSSFGVFLHSDST